MKKLVLLTVMAAALIAAGCQDTSSDEASDPPATESTATEAETIDTEQAPPPEETTSDEDTPREVEEPESTDPEDAAIERTRRFYSAFDDDAIRLDALIRQVQNGNDDAIAPIKRLEKRVDQRILDWFVGAEEGNDIWPGANGISSAAANAVAAAETGDQAGLARAREELAEARDQLAAFLVESG